ncbi:MAG: DUF4124 domain-containing protein [Gammaproteobacteria bacterium]|nr:DUF4124 domain-containing protein [Gammaproteobacteria bacterium]
MIGFIKTLLKLAIVLGAVVLGLLVLKEKGYLNLARWTSDDSQTLVTYYQWQDRQGRIHISQSRPPAGTAYHQFSGSPGMATDTKSTATEPTKDTSPQIKLVADAELLALQQLQQQQVVTDCRWTLGEMIVLKQQILKSNDQQKLAEQCANFDTLATKLDPTRCRLPQSLPSLARCAKL